MDGNNIESEQIILEEEPTDKLKDLSVSDGPNNSTEKVPNEAGDVPAHEDSDDDAR